MPQIIESDVRQSGFFQDGLEVFVDELFTFTDRPNSVMKTPSLFVRVDKATVLVTCWD